MFSSVGPEYTNRPEGYTNRSEKNMLTSIKPKFPMLLPFKLDFALNLFILFLRIYNSFVQSRFLLGKLFLKVLSP